MAAWIRVFCTRPVSQLSADNILEGISAADFYTEAEGLGIEDSDVEQALSFLRIETLTGPSDARFELFYRPKGMRQITIWVSSEELDEELEEVLELLEDISPSQVKRVKAFLDKTIEIVALELGWSQLEDMAVVLAYEVTRYLARVGKGLVLATDDTWWEVKDGVFKPITTIVSQNGSP